MREADVHGGHSHAGVGNISQRGAAGVVAVVGEGLGGDVMILAELTEVGRRERVGGVFLCGAVFHHDAAIDDRAVARVGVFRMVRVDAVGVVSGNHEAPCDHGHGLVIGVAQAHGEAGQHIVKECGAGALGGGTSHFFVVEEGIEGNIFLLLALGETAEAGECTLQVVELRRGNKFLLFAPQGAGHAAVEEEVMSEDVFGFHFRSRCHHIHEGGLATIHAIEREHVFLHLPLFVLIHAAIHMDGYVRNHQHGAVHGHQLFSEMAILGDDEPTGYREGTVEPGAHEHAAVAFYIEAYIGAVVELRIFFDLEGRRIAVGSGDVEGLCFAFRDGEGHEGAAAAGDHILAAFLDVPAVLFADFCEACIEERGLDALHCVEHGG